MKGIYTQLEVKPPTKNAFYGFMSKTHFLLSTAYSLLCARKWFDRIVYYTDEKSWEHLSVLEGLIDEVIFIPEDSVPKECLATWSAGKMWVLSQQTEPFMHLDNDAYVLTPKLGIIAEQERMVCHIFEPTAIHGDLYKKQFEIIKKYGTEELPGFEHDFKSAISSYATGVIGGQDHAVISGIFRNILNFLHNKKPSEDLATGLEQGYLAMYCRSFGIEPYPMLLENRNYIKSWREMNRTGYIHLVGHLKKQKVAGEDLVLKYAGEKLILEVPELYMKIINLQ